VPLGCLFTSNHIQGFIKHHHLQQTSLGKSLANEKTKEDVALCNLIGQPKRGFALWLLCFFSLFFSKANLLGLNTCIKDMYDHLRLFHCVLVVISLD